MKKLFIALFLFLFISISAHADELISEQTQDTTPARTDMLVAELTDNSDFIYFTIEQMFTTMIGANYDTSAELDAFFAAKAPLTSHIFLNSMEIQNGVTGTTYATGDF